MANMSYCRFENTERDLADCLEALNNREISSEREKKIAKRMLKDILEFLIENDIIEDYKEESIDSIIDECE